MGIISRKLLVFQFYSSKETLTMKVSILVIIFISMVSENIFGNPVPENDVHFHVNMPGAGKSYPLRNKGSKGKEAGKDYTDRDNSEEGEGIREKKKKQEQPSGVTGNDYWHWTRKRLFG